MLKRMLVRLFVAAASLTAVTATAYALRPALVETVASAAQQPQTPAARDQYIPIDQLPASEQMPSAPFVVAAYSVVWILAMFYLWTIWRRIGKVEEDMRALARRQKDAGR
jgi:hypothetical protein